MVEETSLMNNPFVVLGVCTVIVVLLVIGSIKLVKYLLNSTNDKPSNLK